jgi:hypothetical protein
MPKQSDGLRNNQYWMQSDEFNRLLKQLYTLCGQPNTAFDR